MKQLILLSFAAFITCQEVFSQQEALDQATGFAQITATIDGLPFSARVNYVMMVEGNLNLGLIGSSDAQIQIEQGDIGTFSFDQNQPAYVITAMFDVGDGRRIVANAGTLIIESLEPELRGSFSFTGTDMNGSTNTVISISNGYINGRLASR